MDKNEQSINIDYLRKGVYFDKLANKNSNISEAETYSRNMTDEHKKKYMNYSNSLNKLLNDETYKSVVNNNRNN